MGIISGVSHESTASLYTIEDGTGSINARLFIGDDDSTSDQAARAEVSLVFEILVENCWLLIIYQWVAGVYVRVTGHLRAFQDKPSVTVHIMYTIKDFNEITYHFLEAITVHLKQQRNVIGLNVKGGGMPGTGVSAGAAAAAALGAYGQPKQEFGSYGSQSYQMNNQMGDESLSPCANAVIHVVRASGASDLGCSRDNIMRALEVQFSRDEINKAIEFVNEEGHVYTTSDDDHFKATS